MEDGPCCELSIKRAILSKAIRRSKRINILAWLVDWGYGESEMISYNLFGMQTLMLFDRSQGSMFITYCLHNLRAGNARIVVRLF
ncbi:hypothetical protein HR08_08780 [Porphyromonas gulae]|uniref:Uncharacterized protein n=1 Tax=Porphyromonas gulae TaxID=111105 RepID=A0A0A2F7X9_9PORP|nr:hypothetical protein HR08_08780 [Porphyromonas gulae]